MPHLYSTLVAEPKLVPCHRCLLKMMPVQSDLHECSINIAVRNLFKAAEGLEDVTEEPAQEAVPGCIQRKDRLAPSMNRLDRWTEEHDKWTPKSGEGNASHVPVEDRKVGSRDLM